MYCYKTDKPQRKPQSARPMHNEASTSQFPIQMKKLKDCATSEIAPYRPLLWSREKFLTFLRFFQDREIGDPEYSEEILRLIREFQTPQIITDLSPSANFHTSVPLPPHFSGAPMSADNLVFHANDLFHLQLGFRSIAILRKIPPSNQYSIIKILKYVDGTQGFKDETDMTFLNYENALSKEFHQARNKNQVSEASSVMSKIIILSEKKKALPISSVVTAQVSSCTFAAMTDRQELFAVVMHLDCPTPTNTSGVRTILLQAGIPDVKMEHLFVSRIEEDAEAAKEQEIFDDLGMRQYGVPMWHQTRLNRGKSGDFLRAQHRLIGIDFTTGRAVIHGSSGDMVLPSSHVDSSIKTGAQHALMSLAQNIVRDYYDDFISKSRDEIYPLSPAISDIVWAKIDRKAYEKIRTSDPKETYRRLLEHEPHFLDIFSVYDTSFFTMELDAPNSV